MKTWIPGLVFFGLALLIFSLIPKIGFVYSFAIGAALGLVGGLLIKYTKKGE